MISHLKNQQSPLFLTFCCTQRASHRCWLIIPETFLTAWSVHSLSVHSLSWSFSSVLDMVKFCTLSFYLLMLKCMLFLLRKTVYLLHLSGALFRSALPLGQKLTRSSIQHLLVGLFDLCLKGAWYHWDKNESGRCLHVPFHFMVSPVTSDESGCKK